MPAVAKQSPFPISNVQIPLVVVSLTCTLFDTSIHIAKLTIFLNHFHLRFSLTFYLNNKSNFMLWMLQFSFHLLPSLQLLSSLLHFKLWHVSTALTFCLTKTMDFISLNIFKFVPPNAIQQLYPSPSCSVFHWCFGVLRSHGHYLVHSIFF